MDVFCSYIDTQESIIFTLTHWLGLALIGVITIQLWRISKVKTSIRPFPVFPAIQKYERWGFARSILIEYKDDWNERKFIDKIILLLEIFGTIIISVGVPCIIVFLFGSVSIFGLCETNWGWIISEFAKLFEIT